MGPFEGASATPREAPARRLIDAPSFVARDWLPLGAGLPGLEDLAADHRRLLDQLEAAMTEQASLKARFDAEDKADREAMRDEFLSGTPGDRPEPTPPEKRTALLRDVEARLRAGNDALEQWIEAAIARIEKDAGEWLGVLADRREEASEQRREAQRLLAEAAAAELSVVRVEEWVTRNAGLHERAAFRNIPEVRFVSWPSVADFSPPPEPMPDGMGGYQAQLVRSFPGAEQHAAALNRGRVPTPAEMRTGPEEESLEPEDREA